MKLISLLKENHVIDLEELNSFLTNYGYSYDPDALPRIINKLNIDTKTKINDLLKKGRKVSGGRSKIKIALQIDKLLD